MPATIESSQKYILGLDLGSASIGWAVILLDQNEEPCKLLAAGAHIFDPGVEKPPAVGQMSQDELILRGLDRSKAAGRRIARQQRRQIDHRALRVKKLFKLLQANKLLPTYPEHKTIDLADERFQLFERLDKKMTDNLCAIKRSKGVMLEGDQALPYVLRKEALERKLDPWELGRALYHLCQRRGYRASAADKDEEETETVSAEDKAKKGRKKQDTTEGNEDEKKEASRKQVEAGILDLQEKMDAAYAPTYGAYFANFINNDPHKERIRKRWTSRDKYIKEFKLIWNTQRKFYRNPDPTIPKLLTNDLRKKVRDCLFYQRPLASAAHLIGRCELVPEAYRAPWATLEAQRFRLLQKVGDLAYLPAGERNEVRLKLARQKTLADALETRGEMTFEQIATLLSLPPDTYFNLPRGKEKQQTKKIIGNRINHLMLRIFGDRWTKEFSDDQRRKAVKMWATSADLSARKEDAKTHWDLDGDAAKLWAEERPPKDYCKFSLAALRRLNGGMEQGIHWTTIAAEMRSRLAPKEPLKFIPPVMKALPAINNPAVLRALTELRKVVNAIIREYKRPPHEIRIELARELRKNRKQRHDAMSRNETNQAARIEAAKKLLKEYPEYDAPTRNPAELVRQRAHDIKKMLLHAECGGHCPYTGNPISYQALFSGEVEVDHIIPQGLMKDDEFNNLTLCFRETNLRKLDKTPWRVFDGASGGEQWLRIEAAFKKFKNPAKLAKLHLHSAEDVERFAKRRLNDTRYTSKLAGRLLMNLYGGRDIQAPAPDDPLEEFKDRTGRRAITVSTGMHTHLLRDAWELHLGELIGEEAFKCPSKTVDEDDSGRGKKPASGSRRKDRCDHRHHAIDAVVIALTSERTIQEIDRISKQLVKERGEQYSPRDLMKKYRDYKFAQQERVELIDDDFREVFKNMVVSRRSEHKLSGGLHQETFYPKERAGGFRHQRISITKFKDAKNEEAELKHIKKIVDEDIKRAVLRFREKIGTFKKWSEERDGWPKLDQNRRGKPLPAENIRPIKKVRIKINKNVETIGKNRSEIHWRYVEEGEIAYVSIFTVQDNKGTRWEADFVKLFKAVARVRGLAKADRGNKRISEVHSEIPNAVFRFSLMKGDLVELLHNGKPGIFVVRRFESDGRFWVAPINAAGKDEDMKAAKRLLRVSSITSFMKMGAGEDKIPQPVFVDPLGRPHNIAVKA